MFSGGPSIHHLPSCPSAYFVGRSLAATHCSRKTFSIEDAFSQLSISTNSIGPRRRITEGSDKPKRKPGSRYCGNAYGAYVSSTLPLAVIFPDSDTFAELNKVPRFGVILELGPAWLLCVTLLILSKINFRSASCSNKELDNAPVLLSIPTGRQTLKADPSTTTSSADPPRAASWIVMHRCTGRLTKQSAPRY